MPRLEYRSEGRSERRGVNPFPGESLTIPSEPGYVRFFEAEQVGSSVLYASGDVGGPVKRRRSEHESEDEAHGACASALWRKRRGGYVPAGHSREIEGFTAPRRGSALLIDAYFAEADPRFLDEVLRFDGGKKLAALAKPWFEDPRPFARRALLDYVDDGAARPQHKALVKRLFKLAEAARDDELVGRFMVAFDRLLRRSLRVVSREWDPSAQQWQPVRALATDPGVRERLEQDQTDPDFTRATRRYLMRRAFRYFRRIGYRDAAGYRRAIVPALMHYRDEHLSTVGRLLSAWGLLHALYGRSAVLSRHPRGIRVAPERTLAELTPAPIFSAAWDDAFDDLRRMLLFADSRTVRAWALALLKERYREKLEQLTLAQVKALALATTEEAQVLGVELFSRLPNLERASLSDWLELLGAENLEVLAAVCDRAADVVSGARLSLSQCVELALSPAAPLAALGLSWLKDKRVTSEEELSQLLRLSAARVPAVRSEAAPYIAEQLRALAFTRAEHVRELCDAAHVEVRGHGLKLALERYADDLSLWSALSESPYPDVRSFLLARGEALQLERPESLAHLLGTVLCSLWGAASDKRNAAREIAARAVSTPAEAPRLLPLMRVALKSVHPAERSLALAQLARAAHANVELRGVLAQSYPELTIAAQVSE